MAMTPRQHHQRHQRMPAGFSLVELLITLVLGLALGGALMQALLAETGASQRLGRLLRERQLSQRALELIREELQQAHWVRSADGPAPSAELNACAAAGRTPVLQLGTPAGVITYTVGAAPSAIWRGRVLMRCGPAYGLAGEFSSGSAQNRVLLDGLVNDSEGLAAVAEGRGVLRLSLLRQLSADQQLQQQITAPMPG